MAPYSRRAGAIFRDEGFTLIELMITVAIVAILAVVALASYRAQIVRSNRSAAQSFMLDAASKEERYLLDNRQYASGATALTTLGLSVPAEVSGNYTITITADATLTVPNYTISATPIAAQLRDDTSCGTLTLDYLGTKAASLGGATCWR